MSVDNRPISRETFAAWVHDGLNRLYDTAYLQTNKHLYTALFGEIEESPMDRSKRLRRALLEAIESLRPRPGTPAQSPDWRGFRILELRYLEGLAPNEAMEQLSISKSQFFRDQARVIETVVDYLWVRVYALAEEAGASPSSGDEDQQGALQLEAARLRSSTLQGLVNLVDLLQDLLRVVTPLSRLRGVEICLGGAGGIPPVTDNRIMLRQVLLNLMTQAINLSVSGRVEVVLEKVEDEVCLKVRTAAASAAGQGVELAMSFQLMQEMTGKLCLDQSGGMWEGCITWPLPAMRTLLVIDDNAGLQDLYRRYLGGLNWRVIGTNSGSDAFQVMQEVLPDLILLDIMMPDEDGWEVLVKLKDNPLTKVIPVLICSVVSARELAGSLGAAGCLTKPVSQQALLQALVPWMQAPPSC